jgi:hypothetical protein
VKEGFLPEQKLFHPNNLLKQVNKTGQNGRLPPTSRHRSWWPLGGKEVLFSTKLSRKPESFLRSLSSVPT